MSAISRDRAAITRALTRIANERAQAAWAAYQASRQSEPHTFVRALVDAPIEAYTCRGCDLPYSAAVHTAAASA